MALVTKNFSDIITFTRASTGTYFNSSGVLTSAAIDAPRFDYNPSTLAAQGLLIEEARTNSIRNNTMVGAVAGTPGTVPTNWQATSTGGSVTRTVVGAGTENGINYIDIRYQFSGAASAQIITEQSNQIAASSGQTWASFSYSKLVGGSLTNIAATLNIQELNAGGTGLATTTTAFTPTSNGLATQKYSNTRNLNQATCAFVIQYILLTASGAADITLRIGLPQLELGAFATSVIPTTTTALTRSADVASVNTLAPWFNSAAGTLFAESQQLAVQTATAFPRSAQIDDGSNNNLITTIWRTDTNRLYGAVTTGGVNQADVGTNGVTQTNVNKVALAYATNDFAASTNGGAPSTDVAGTVPTGLTTLRLGSAFGSAILNGYIRRITYYPRRLSNAELQAITA